VLGGYQLFKIPVDSGFESNENFHTSQVVCGSGFKKRIHLQSRPGIRVQG